jgi:tetratricopeptide (TPR) repeat protein
VFLPKRVLRIALIFHLAIYASLCSGQDPTSRNEIDAIKSALRTHDFTQAITLSNEALSRQPGDYRIWAMEGMATAAVGNLSGALSAYQQALKLAPTYLPALEGAAQTAFQMGQDSAEPTLLKVLEQRPDDPTSHAMLGVLAFRKEDCPNAVVHFQRASAVIAKQFTALTQYGACLSILNRNDEAVNVFSEALALEPQKKQARYNLARAEQQAHHSEDALATLQPLIDATSVEEDALSLDAEILESKGDTPRAIEVLRRAILADPKAVGPYLQFAALSYDHASPRVGIDILNAGLTQLPGEPKLYLVRGVLLTQLGEFARAAKDFDAADRIDPQLSFLGVAQGLVKSQQHNSAAALAEFRAAVKAHPNEAYAQYLLAEALIEQGAPQGSPEYEEEVEAAKRAATLDPRLVAAHDLLGTVYLENGHIQQSIEHSRTALALDPTDQQAVYHLIVAMRKTDQKDQVPALLKRLLEIRAGAKSDQSAGNHYRLTESPAAVSGHTR